jgi:hypothetical protein
MLCPKGGFLPFGGGFFGLSSGVGLFWFGFFGFVFSILVGLLAFPLCGAALTFFAAVAKLWHDITPAFV